MTDEACKVWICQSYGYIYDEYADDPSEGLGPETRWTEIPEDWLCPMCRTPTSDFDMVET
ncbi:rubredoxin [Sorangium sp. So ce1128]